MEVTVADEQQFISLLEQYPGAAPVLCHGETAFTLLALDDDKVIAFASVVRREIPAPLNGQTEDFINVIDVNPDYQNRGIGSKLVDEIKKIAVTAGCVQVRAYCDINNAPSHALWFKNGFGISPVKNADGSIPGSFVTYRL